MLQPRGHPDEGLQVLAGDLLLAGFDGHRRDAAQRKVMSIRRVQPQLGDRRQAIAQIGRRGHPHADQPLAVLHLGGDVSTHQVLHLPGHRIRIQPFERGGGPIDLD